MRELYRLLTSRRDWDAKEISAISNTLIDAIHSEILYIDGEHFLRVTDTEDADKMEVELWKDSKDADGNGSVSKVDCSKEEMLEVLHENYKKGLKPSSNKNMGSV